MMKRFLAGTLAMAFWAGSAQAQTTITYTPGSGTLPLGSTILYDFENLTPGSSLGPNAYVDNSTFQLGARPAFGSTGNFATIFGGGSFAINFNPTSLLSFVLGSLDSFNSVTLLYQSGAPTVLTGGAIVADPSIDSGNRSSGETNGVVTYRVTGGPLLTGAIFSSSSSSFELDNIATSVPEPAAWGMMILGFGLVGSVLRRRSADKVAFTY
ncbi:PEPxxWA-CTERM sorting domain-containing protein [Sphingomonas bacterium]|uniref:PEPxxWA-CTERM sorting domain-containing protein n=1 Tax=Sphingomonas bacterium TaxID=1895847 RepID=UPI0020C696B3|nr:PEPxxWA-CTERM sorting domain-containing protein [Sphingomonas bacterium]